MTAKEKYLELIDEQVERRAQALRFVSQATLDNYNEKDILRFANDALTAYRNLTRLKAEMREKYPTQCTCQCVNHKIEAENSEK